MKILGGKHLLEITEPKLIYQFWESTNECKKVLKNPTKDYILNIIESRRHQDFHDDSAINEFNFSIWICSNAGQVTKLVKNENQILMLDTNVCGDADPCSTLWFVFENNEWKVLDEYFNVDFSKEINDVWDECVSLSKEFNDIELTKENIARYVSEIVNVNIKVNIM